MLEIAIRIRIFQLVFILLCRALLNEEFVDRQLHLKYSKLLLVKLKNFFCAIFSIAMLIFFREIINSPTFENNCFNYDTDTDKVTV